MPLEQHDREMLQQTHDSTIRQEQIILNMERRQTTVIDLVKQHETKIMTLESDAKHHKAVLKIFGAIGLTALVPVAASAWDWLTRHFSK